VNPIVLISTAVAFPGRPAVVVARFGASLTVAIVMGLLVLRTDSGTLADRVRRLHPSTGSRWRQFVATTRHDFVQAGGFLVVGAAGAALIQVAVPSATFAGVARSAIASVLVMAALAVLMSICSEADAFVAASFTQVSPTAQLVFMVVGPAVDLKLAAMQVGVFGAGFARWFAPTTMVVAVLAGVGFGWLLL
jgi:uncharacterized membrane protein YraQ (UPF0718 family)